MYASFIPILLSVLSLSSLISAAPSTPNTSTLESRTLTFGQCTNAHLQACIKINKVCGSDCLCVPIPAGTCSNLFQIGICALKGLATGGDCKCIKGCPLVEQAHCWKKHQTIDASSCSCPSYSGGHQKRDMTRANAVCTEGFTACPTSYNSKGFECLDVNTDNESCGGCSAAYTGTDCTLLDGVSDVACVGGSCQVRSCDVGFTININGTGCDIVERGFNREKLVMGSLKGVDRFWGY